MNWYDHMPAGLPDGRLITPYNGVAPRYWLSTEPVEGGEWATWHERHRQTGLWPVLVSHVSDDDPFKSDAECDRITTIEEHDGPALLAQWWYEVTTDDGEIDPDLVEAIRLDAVGLRWPGITDPPLRQGPPDRFAAQFADLLAKQGTLLALAPGVDGAHALTALGWTGPLNHDNDTAKFAAVVHDWQHRFGATVVGLSFDTLSLGIAAPPITNAQALRVTAEHLAFCPDNIWQGEHDNIPDYADDILGATGWSFWWD